MNILKAIARWFDADRPPEPDSATSKTLNVGAVRKEDERKAMESSILQDRCPDCGGEGFYEGPAGGACQNIICRNEECGARFNVGPYIGGSFMVCERVS